MQATPSPNPRQEERFLLELADLLPPDAIVTDPVVTASYRSDHARFVDAGDPLAVVLPRSTDEVAHTLSAATRHGIPVVARGAGSGLSGGANALDGWVVLSMTRMNRIVEIDKRNLLAVVEPGVLTGELQRAVAELGLWYPPDPSSFEISTIGGNIATNAGGLCCVKYGVTGDSVLGLEVVLADGSQLRTGGRTVKGVAGYDLTRLLVGSEGTLGVVTQAVVRLRPARAAPGTLLASFPTLQSSGDAVSKIIMELVPSLLELMDRTTVMAVEEWRGMGLETGTSAVLLAQAEATAEGSTEMQQIERLCREAAASDVIVATDQLEADYLMEARRAAFPALERLGDVVLDDVAVPRARITDLLVRIEEISVQHGVQIGTFGHAGDGNMHPTIIFVATDPDSVRSARVAFEFIIRTALELGGTVTGEHGVGMLKQPYLAGELGPEAMRVHRAIKHALDPTNTLNPGKAF